MGLARTTKAKGRSGEKPRKHQEQHNEDDHAHDDDVVTDAGPNVQPAPRVPNKEEELESQAVGQQEHHQEETGVGQTLE